MRSNLWQISSQIQATCKTFHLLNILQMLELKTKAVSIKPSKTGSINLCIIMLIEILVIENIIQLHIICTTNLLVKECSWCSLFSSQLQVFLSLFAAFMNPTITCISSNCFTVQKQLGAFRSQFPKRKRKRKKEFTFIEIITTLLSGVELTGIK